MSYPAPPPPGGTGVPNPYQGGPQGSSPYGPGSNPYGGVPPQKKDNTLWWILGIIAAFIALCCAGACAALIFVGNEASDTVSSYSSSVNSSKYAGAASASPITEGGGLSVDGAAIQPGWSIDSSDDITDLSVRNDSGSRDSFTLNFYFMQDGEVIDDISCVTSFLDSGDTDDNVTCVPSFSDIQDADEIRVSEGY